MKTLVLYIMLILITGTTHADSEITEIARLGRGSAWTLSWHPDGNLLAVGGSAGIWLFDENYQQLEHYPSPPVRRVEFSPDGNYLMVFHTFDMMELWHFDKDGKLLERPKAVTINGYSAQWSPDSQWIATYEGSWEQGEFQGMLIEVWDVANLEPIWTKSSMNILAGIVWSPDSQFLAGANQDGSVVIIDTMSGEIRETIPLPDDLFQETLIETMGIAYQIDGQGLWLIFLGSGSLWSLDLENHQLSETDIIVPFLKYGLWQLELHPEKNLLITETIGGGGDYGGLYILSEEIEPFQIGYHDSIVDYAWVRGTDRLTVLTGNNMIHDVNLKSDNVIEYQLFADSGHVEWSPDGQWIVQTTGYNPFDFQYPVMTWNISETNLESYDTTHIMYPYLSAKWSRWLPDSKHVMIYSDNTVPHAQCLVYGLEQWDIVEDDHVLYWEDGLCGLQNMDSTTELNWEYVMDWTDDFTQVAYANGNDITIAEPSTYRAETMTFTAKGRVTSIEWSNDESSLLSISKNRDNNETYIEIWNVESGNRTFQFTISHDFISANWSPDAQILNIMTGKDDNFTLMLIDLLTGNVIVEKAFSTIPSLSWKPDASQLLISNLDDDVNHISLLGIADQTIYPIEELSKQNITGFDWHPIYNWLAVSTGDELIIYDTESQDVIKSVSTNNGIIGWSPDGTKLATRNTGLIISIWEINIDL